MLFISERIRVRENEMTEEFIRSSGPGGQNVNKVATAVQLRFHLDSSSLPVAVKKRLKVLARTRLTAEGDILIEAKRHRTQEQNRTDARERLIRLIKKALVKPKKRIKTRPSAASKKKRLENKRHRSKIKSTRKKVKGSDQ